jgi:ABC-type multidrug transport system fused ATPase/permease subunit
MIEVPKKKITLEGLKNAFKLYSYIKPYRIEYGIGMFFLIGSSAASLAFPKLLGELVDSGSKGNLSNDINKIAFFIVITLLLQAVFSYFRVVFFVNVTEKALADIRQKTYSHMIKLPLKFFEKHRVGELNSRISSDISLLQETLTSTLAEFFRQIIYYWGYYFASINILEINIIHAGNNTGNDAPGLLFWPVCEKVFKAGSG